MKTAVIYARYSSERQNEQSIEGQLRVCNQYAESNGLTIIDTYIDRAMTGTNDQRIAFQQMLSDSSKPVPWDIVLVYAIDRFGRNSIEIAVNKQKLKKNKKVLISATQRTSENIDGSKNLDGILLENMYIGLAEYYSAELSQKVLRGLHENRVKGLFCGGRISYGYKVLNKRVLINDDEAEIVRYIFQQYSSGIIVQEIIQSLTERGILYKERPFLPTMIYKMLRCSNYIGISHRNDGIYDNLYPPIIAKPLFEKVQIILAKNKLGSRSTENEFLLRSKIICGYCKKHLQGESGTTKNGTKKYYYKCMGRKKLHICNKKTIPKEKLENLVIDVTLQIMSNSVLIEQIADGIIKAHDENRYDKSTLNILTNERDKIKKSLSNVMKAIEEGIFTPTTKTRMQELENQLSEIEDKILIEQYNAQTKLTREQIIQYLTHSIRTEPKLMIYTFIEKIILFDDKIEIYYNYTDSKKPDHPIEGDRAFCILSGSDSYTLVRHKEFESLAFGSVDQRSIQLS